MSELKGKLEGNVTSLSELSKEADSVKTVTEDEIRKDLGVEKEPEQEKGMMHDIIAMSNAKTKNLETAAQKIVDEKRMENELEEMDGDDQEPEDSFDDEVEEDDYTVPEQGSIDDMLSELDEDLDDEDDVEMGTDELQKQFKDSLDGKLEPVRDKIDLATFTVKSKAVSVYEAFRTGDFSKAVKLTDWFLPSTGQMISMKPFKAVDIVKLNPEASTQSPLNTYRSIYKLIHDHIEGANKPDLEEFLKLIRFDDIPHLYFTIYKAAFEGVNTMPYQCPECETIFAEDNVPMDEVVVFKDEEYEKNFKDVFNSSDSSFKTKEFETTRVQISDNFVFEIRKPSIFNVIFENLYLKESFREKYSDIISIISYLEAIYLIDRADNTLSPIETKVYKNDVAKSIKAKISSYSRIINSLSSDQYYSLFAEVNKLSTDDEIKYVQPGRDCPKCKHHIEEVPQSPEAMLFSRHQLGAIKNS